MKEIKLKRRQKRLEEEVLNENRRKRKKVEENDGNNFEVTVIEIDRAEIKVLETSEFEIVLDKSSKNIPKSSNKAPK